MECILLAKGQRTALGLLCVDELKDQLLAQYKHECDIFFAWYSQ